MPGRTLLVALFLAAAPGVGATSPAPADKPSPEEEVLKRTGASVDDDGLLSVFRGRTLSDRESRPINDCIQRLSADDFDERERASAALREFGPRATPLVRAAAHGSDAEIARRARRFLSEVDPPAPLPAVAAARLLARRGNAEGVPVLLAYLPFAGDEAVEEEVRAALLALTRAGKADPALAAALSDAQPAKRAAAAYVLGRKGGEAQRAAVRKKLEDGDAKVRLRAAVGLMGGGDKAGVPALVDLLADGPADVAWQAEATLHGLAGDKAPKEWLGNSAESRRKCRDAWSEWWKRNGDDVSLAHFEMPGPLLGYTLGVEYNTGRVWECDIDGSIRWEIHDLAGPMDAQVLPNDRVLIAEANTHAITERDFKGNVLREKKIDGEPNGCRRLADGSTFVTTPGCAMEFAPDGTTVYSIKIDPGSVGSNAVCKGRDGCIYYAADSSIQEMDASGKPLRAIPLPAGEVLYVGLDDLPGDRFLVADSRKGRVLEVGPDGKVLWQADVPAACGVQRLPNGHTLVSTNHKVIELDAFGHRVWEKDAEGYPRRVYRR